MVPSTQLSFPANLIDSVFGDWHSLLRTRQQRLIEANMPNPTPEQMKLAKRANIDGFCQFVKSAGLAKNDDEAAVLYRHQLAHTKAANIRQASVRQAITEQFLKPDAAPVAAAA